ncbi:MAG: dnaX, partial [Ilumatobacteraceae bacterium]|nr:dnaX [Ilumatobacteraceae bacterium]
AAPAPPMPAASPAAPAPAPAPAVASGDLLGTVSQAWQPNILPTLKPMARALFSAGHFVGEQNGSLSFGLPNDTHRSRCESYRADVEAAIANQIGRPVTLSLVVDTSGPPDDHLASVVPLRKGPNAGMAVVVPTAPADEDVDISDLVDAPPGSMKTPEERLAEAFPGSIFVDESR